MIGTWVALATASLGSAVLLAVVVVSRRAAAMEDPAGYLRRRTLNASRWAIRRRFKRIAAANWPDGITPAPPQPSTSDEHFRRIANEVVPDNAIDWEDPK